MAEKVLFSKFEGIVEEEMVNEDVLQMIANVLGTCIDELDECTTDEERLSTLGHALKSMVVLGRWSVLQ